MLPILLKLFDEELIFDSENTSNEKVIPIYKIFDFQTSLYFCVLSGTDRATNWYLLNNSNDGKEEDTFDELKFVCSSRGRFDVYSSNGDLKPINDIKKYLTELDEKVKDCEILGIKKDCANEEIILKAWGAQRRIFSYERDLHYIFNNARDRLLREIKSLGFVEISTDLSIDVYFDEDFIETMPYNINSQPIRSKGGEHQIVLKKDNHEIGSATVYINPGNKEKVNIPISIRTNGRTELEKKVQNLKNENQNLKNENNKFRRQVENIINGEQIPAPSKITLSLLVLLAIMSAIDIISPSPLLFILYIISFIGVFYKRRKMGSGLAMLSGFLSLPGGTFIFLLGCLLMFLGWKEYSVLKTS